jgi:hypothetical protein
MTCINGSSESDNEYQGFKDIAQSAYDYPIYPVLLSPGCFEFEVRCRCLAPGQPASSRSLRNPRSDC